MLTEYIENEKEKLMIKEPKEYAQEVKNLGYTKIEFFEHMLDNKMPRGYILDCLEAW